MNPSPAKQSETSAALSIERWSATSGSARSSRANLILVGGGHRWRANAGGNGAVDALLHAVDNALTPLLGDGVVLVSYDVHATGSGHDAKASITVGVRRSNAPEAPIYPGRAVHDNILQASVEAYVDAIGALLTDEGVDIAASKPSPGDTDRHGSDPNHRADARDKIMSAYNS